MITNRDNTIQSDDRKLELFHNTRGNPRAVRCIKDNPQMTGFGRQLKIGDIVIINGTVANSISFEVSVPAECAFYEYEAFEPTDEFFNQ